MERYRGSCADTPTCGTLQEPCCGIQYTITNRAAAPPTVDTIRVCPHTYNTNVGFLNKHFELIAVVDQGCAQPSETATIQGEVEIKGVPPQGPESVVQGFKIQGGPNGVEVRNGADPRIIGNTITETTAFGGVYVIGDGTNPRITKNTVTGNFTSGIRIDGGAPTLIRNMIVGNTEGVFIQNAAATLRDNTITANSSSGVILTGALPGTTWIIGCTISGNTGVRGAGIWGNLAFGGKLQVVNTLIADNVSVHEGGGVYLKSEPAAGAAGETDPCRRFGLEFDMQNCIVTCNHAGGNGGGGVYADIDAKVTMVNSTFTLNKSGDGTGPAAAIGSQAGCVEVHNTILWDDEGNEEVKLLTTANMAITHSILEGGCDGILDPPQFPVTCNDESPPDVADEDPLFVGVPYPGLEPCYPPQCPLVPEQVQVRAGSPAIDCGDNTKVLLDFGDLDGDLDVGERTPLDYFDQPRFHDDPDTLECESAVADPPEYPEVVDIGAFEYPCTSPPTEPVVVVPDLRCQDNEGDPCSTPCTEGVECGPLFNNRFLTMVGEGPQPTALRVLPLTLYDETICGARQPGTHPNVSPFECDPYFVGQPVEHVEDAVPAQPNWIAAATACSPHSRDWTGDGLFQWFQGANGIPGDPIDPTVFHVFGGEIMPCSTYAVQVLHGDCAAFPRHELAYGPPILFITEKFGDVWPELHPEPGEPSFVDIGQVTNKFKSMPPPDTPIEAQALLARNVPRPYSKVDFQDIGAAVDGFKSLPYREHGPCPCPTEVVCGTLECDHCVGNGEPCDTNEDCPVGDECVTCSEGTCSKDEHNMGELRCRDECKRCVPGS